MASEHGGDDIVAVLESSSAIAHLAEEVARYEEVQLLHFAASPSRTDQDTAIVVAIVVCLFVIVLSLGTVFFAMLEQEGGGSGNKEGGEPRNPFGTSAHREAQHVRAACRA
jgi:hypothetical protein